MKIESKLFDIEADINSFGVEAQSNIDYSSNLKDILAEKINEMTYNLDDTKKVEYQLCEFKKTDYKHNNIMISALCKTYPKHLSRESNNIIIMADFDSL